MRRTAILGLGHYVPSRVVTNLELSKRMDTSDEWIQQRTGIKERRHVDFDNEPRGSSDLAVRAAKNALADAGRQAADIDFIIYATLGPDRSFPGDGVLVGAKLDIPASRRSTSATSARASSTASRSPTPSSRRACTSGPSTKADQGVLSAALHADGRFADEPHLSYPSSAVMPRITEDDLRAGRHYPMMNGKTVFKHAVVRMPEAVGEVLAANDLTVNDIDMLIVCLAAFGAGFTWGSALLRY